MQSMFDFKVSIIWAPQEAIRMCKIIDFFKKKTFEKLLRTSWKLIILVFYYLKKAYPNILRTCKNYFVEKKS